MVQNKKAGPILGGGRAAWADGRGVPDFPEADFTEPDFNRTICKVRRTEPDRTLPDFHAKMFI